MPANGPRIIDAGMLLCAVALTGLLVRREFAARPPVQLRSPVAVSNWGDLQAGGHRMGRADARVTIVEVSDFQCPFCARFALTALPAIRRRYPDDVAVVYRHWPLSIHPFAFDAAVASECAAAQGRFEPFHDALFRDQDSIGTRPFERFAVDAGVTDTAAFRLCRTSPQAAARVESDRRAALALGAGGTPSFVVNGYLLHAPLDSALLDSIVRAARPR